MKEFRPHSSSLNEESPQKQNLLPNDIEDAQQPPPKITKLKKPSFVTILDGPLNNYQDFKNVFNAKNVGSKTNRRHAQSKSIN
jgi:hypothetical protein